MPTVNIEGVNIFYEVKGQGIPIVFIHPPLLTSTNFKYQIEELSKCFKTIVFDIRGHGNSAISEEPISYPLISSDIVHLLDELNVDKAFLCGYSTGGEIALDFLLSHPERAKGAILISAMSEVNDWLLKREISLAIFFSKNKLINTLATSICYGNSNNKATFKELFHEAKKGIAKNIKQYYQYSLDYNCTSQLTRIKEPVLLLYGGKNKQFHPYAHLISKILQNNMLHFIANGKHQLPTKSAQEVNTFLREFLYRHGNESL